MSRSENQGVRGIERGRGLDANPVQDGCEGFCLRRHSLSLSSLARLVGRNAISLACSYFLRCKKEPGWYACRTVYSVPLMRGHRGRAVCSRLPAAWLEIHAGSAFITVSPPFIITSSPRHAGRYFVLRRGSPRRVGVRNGEWLPGTLKCRRNLPRTRSVSTGCGRMCGWPQGQGRGEWMRWRQEKTEIR